LFYAPLFRSSPLSRCAFGWSPESTHSEGSQRAACTRHHTVAVPLRRIILSKNLQIL
jgi:hypothetical protein